MYMIYFVKHKSLIPHYQRQKQRRFISVDLAYQKIASWILACKISNDNIDFMYPRHSFIILKIKS